MNLKSYIGAERPRSLRSRTRNIKAEKPESIRWTQQEKHWCRVFLKMKSDRNGTFVSDLPTSVRIWTSFHRLVHAVKDYEQKTKTRVNISTYLRAHFGWYGDELYANQLNSSISWDLYRAYERIENIRYYEEAIDDITADTLMLKRLSEIRQEPEGIVFLSLRKSGLFSRQFIKSRGKQ